MKSFLSTIPNRIKNLAYIIYTHKGVSLTFLLILFILIINTLHQPYPDEFDNITGGYFITQGILPYSGFFTHHGPFAYFFASVIALFSGQSFVTFRILLAITYFLMFLGFYIYTRKRFGINLSNIILFFIIFLSIASTYVWAQMLLSDSLAGLLLIPAYIITFITILRREPFKKIDIILLSILLFSTLLTSLTYLYAVIFIYLFIIFWFLKTIHKKISLATLKLFIALGTPYVVFLLYLLITGSLSDYYYQSIVFNRDYYVTSFGDGPVRNPLRLAIIILMTFVENFRAILVQVKDLNLGNPFAHSLALANLTMMIYLLINRKFLAALLLFLTVVYVTARSNPYSTTETDYQGIPYQYLGIFNGLFLLSLLWEDLKEKLPDNKKIIYGFFIIFLGIYFIYLFLFLFEKASDKAYKKYMGTQSLIYDRPSVAPTLNQLISPNDYYYIGPFSFEDHLYANGKLASKYFITIPAMDKSDRIKNELLADMNKNRPPVIVFNTEHYIFGSRPGGFLVDDFIRNNYFNLEQLKSEGMKFQISNKQLGDYDFERHFFFDKNKKDELVKKLTDLRLIIPEQTQSNDEQSTEN